MTMGGRANMNDADAEARRNEFAQLVRACQSCASEASRPWRIGCAVLTVALAAVICWRR